MKQLILLLSLIPFAGMATTYTTLTDGNWTNTTSVWSTDGINPCSCAPSTTTTGDTIIIKHLINQNTGVSLSDQSYLVVNPGATLNGTGFYLNVYASEVLIQGEFITKKLDIGATSLFTLEVAEMTVQSRIEISGTLIVNTGNLTVVMGNVLVYSTGVFELNGTSKLYFQSGNFQNSGNTNLANGSCIQLGTGNILNDVSGTVSGMGSMISDNGNVQNDGIWGTDVNWCSAGFDFGMPIPENCAAANANCQGAPLPVELVVFEGQARSGYNQIVWITESEIQCDYFILERSHDGSNWIERAVVDGAGTTTLETYYEVRDNIELSGIYYYRLTQYDFDENKTVSPVIAVRSIGEDSQIYPNPNNGEFILVMNNNDISSTVRIFDMAGLQVYEAVDLKQEKIGFHLLLSPGTYIVIIDHSDTTSESLKLVIR